MQKILSAIGLSALVVSALACGQESEEATQPAIQAHFLDSEGNAFEPLANPDNADLPTTLILTLIGPDGSRTETIDFAERKIALGELRQGTWSIRGDGLDENGSLRWQADPTTFTIRPEKTASVQLSFRELE